MDELSITVTIADRIYRLTIERKEEEIVRKAVKLIDVKVKEYAKSYDFKDKQDLLAMAVLHYTTSLLNQELAQKSGLEEQIGKLTEIDGILDKYIE